MNWEFTSLDDDEHDYELFLELRRMATDDAMRCLTFMGARSLDDLVAAYPEDDEIWMIDNMQTIFDGSEEVIDEDMDGDDLCIGFVAGYRLKNGMPVLGIQNTSPFIFFMTKEVAEHFKQAVVNS